MVRPLTMGLIALTQIISVFAESNVRCRQPDQIGLFNQCERIHVVGTLDGSVRAYSTATKTVQNFPSSEIFQLQDSKNAGPEVGARVAISSDQYFRICSVKAVNPFVFDCTNGVFSSNMPNIRWYELKKISHP